MKSGGKRIARGISALGFVAGMAASAGAQVVINEIDADTVGTDDMEFVELYDGGAGNTALDGLVVVFFNGSNDLSYAAFDLDGFTTDANGYFVLGNAGVPNVSILFASNGLQNGADAVALYMDDATTFPTNTPVTATNLVDALVHDTSDPDAAGLLAVLGGPQVDENANANAAFDSIARCPAGNGGPLNSAAFVTQNPPTPGADCGITPPSVLINELDCDQTGTDMGEFVELYDGGTGNTMLDGLTVVFYNGSSDTSYAAFDLDGFSTDANGYFLLGNAAVTGVDIVFADNFLQNGADAVALYLDDALNFPNGTGLVLMNLLDAVVYDTSDADDAGLLTLTPGEPQIDENAFTMSVTQSISRCPDGTGGPLVTSGYTAVAPTPKGPCVLPPPMVVINEFDADQTGTDAGEFVELWDFGVGNTSLNGLVLVFFNGFNDASYAAFDLTGFSTDANGYFVVGNTGVAVSDITFPDNTLQNGADGVGLYQAAIGDFPSGTAVTATGLIDMVVYGTGDPDDLELLGYLMAGEPQVDEFGGGQGTLHSNQRCPDGSGGMLVTSTFVQALPTPKAPCTGPLSYCTGKTNSLGCVPFLSYQGTPSASDTNPFGISALDLIPNEFGFFIYGTNGASNLDFHGGKLCVKSPFNRVFPVKASTSSGNPPCSGTFTRNFNLRIQSGSDPALSVGAQVNVQYRQRDPALMDVFNDSLTDGMQFVINP